MWFKNPSENPVRIHKLFQVIRSQLLYLYNFNQLYLQQTYEMNFLQLKIIMYQKYQFKFSECNMIQLI